MNVCIVGHGPSMIGAGLGQRIDAHDLVVRLKGCGPVLNTTDYGSRVDVLCLSTEVLGLCRQVETTMYWLYPKKGRYDHESVGAVLGQVGAGFCLPLALCNDWNNRFIELCGTHPNVSTGMAAIIIASHFLRPQSITLAGFDTLLDPEVKFTRNDKIPRTGVGEIHHDWHTENKLLQEVADTYQVSIGKL